MLNNCKNEVAPKFPLSGDGRSDGGYGGSGASTVVANKLVMSEEELKERVKCLTDKTYVTFSQYADLDGSI